MFTCRSVVSRMRSSTVAAPVLSAADAENGRAAKLAANRDEIRMNFRLRGLFNFIPPSNLGYSLTWVMRNFVPKNYFKLTLIF
ncbi:hypothetical protein D3C81_1846240 [compost metagenome]